MTDLPDLVIKTVPGPFSDIFFEFLHNTLWIGNNGGLLQSFGFRLLKHNFSTVQINMLCLKRKYFINALSTLEESILLLNILLGLFARRASKDQIPFGIESLQAFLLCHRLGRKF